MEPPLLAKVTFATIFEKTFTVKLEKLAWLLEELLVLILYPSPPRCLQTYHKSQIPPSFRSAPNPEGRGWHVKRTARVCKFIAHIVCVEMESGDLNRFKERSHLWGWYFYMSALHRF